MKTLKKIFNIEEYIKGQSHAKQHIANVSKNKGDRKQVPHLKASKIALNRKQYNLVLSWFKPGVGYSIKHK